MLLSHMLKLLGRILEGRMKTAVEGEIDGE